MQLLRGNVLPPGEYLYLDFDVVFFDNMYCLLNWPGFGINRDYINQDNGSTSG